MGEKEMPNRFGICPLCYKAVWCYPLQMYCANEGQHELVPLAPFVRERGAVEADE